MKALHLLLLQLPLVLVPAVVQAQTGTERGGCLPPTALFTNTAGDTARLCQGDVISVNGASSTAAPGRSIEQWIWNYGPSGVDTSNIPFAILSFPVSGVNMLTLEVIDDIGCSSGPSAPIPVLVSPTPTFTVSGVPTFACEGSTFQLFATADQPLMLGAPEACTAGNNGLPLIDTPTPSVSSLVISGQSAGVITDVGQLGDICMDIEHSYMGDLVLTVTCPNGQSVILHQQGGGGTFLGDANDTDGAQIVPGGCFQYCFGQNPDFGTLAGSVAGGATPNTIPTSQGTAIAPGRYTSVQPLTQLVGCPFNGTWTFSSADMFGADNGYLCGWCISFGAETDSSFVSEGPVLGASADSSSWNGPNITNIPGQPGAAVYAPTPGTQTIAYTVLDSYGCEHEATYVVSVGAEPTVTIVENEELGLVCAEVVGGPVSYQWSFQGQVVVGAAGACYTPPGPGLISVSVQNTQGCSDTASLLSTGVAEGTMDRASAFTVFPSPNSGDFFLRLTGPDEPRSTLRVSDMMGRTVLDLPLGDLHGDRLVPISLAAAPGTYLVQLIGSTSHYTALVIIR